MFSYDTAAAIYRCPENNETAIIVPNQAGEVEPFFVNTLCCLFVSFSVSNIRMAADLVTENTLFTSVCCSYRGCVAKLPNHKFLNTS